MADDVNIEGSGYDENLCENPFFKYIETKQKQLYDEAATKRWTVSLAYLFHIVEMKISRTVVFSVTQLLISWFFSI